MLGDTTRAEQTARRFTGMGPYSLNATLWTRGNDEATWVRTTYRRPGSIDEALDWVENAERFRSQQEGNGSVLPGPFARLSAERLGDLDFIIQYDDGTAKAYLFPGTSRSAAEKFVALIGGYEGSEAGGK
jgi:hypothetical protein